MHIYVENGANFPEVYCVSELAVRNILPDTLKSAQITVRNSDQLDVALLESADFFVGSAFQHDKIHGHGHKLQIIHCLTAGVESYLPLDWLPPGAVFTNSSGVHQEKSAIFGQMALLMLNEGIPRYAGNQRQHVWKSTNNTAIKGKTVLIYGFGSIGQAVATHLPTLGMKVIGIRRSGGDHPAASEMHDPTMLHQLLPGADFLVLSCPLTKETRGLIGERELALLPRGAGVLNISRGPVLDNDALTAALASDHLSGAIVDVFEPEPLPPDSPLWDVPNLMILPHVSCDEVSGYIERCLAIFGDNLKRITNGEPLRNVVNPSLEY